MGNRIHTRPEIFLPKEAGSGVVINRRGVLGMEIYGKFVPLPMGGGSYGSLTVIDTLASSQQSIAAYGEDNAFQAIQAGLDAHNAQVREMMSTLVEVTTDRQRRYGGPDTMVMDEVDELGRAQAQKVAAGTTVGFPLRMYEVTVQWTRKFAQNNSVQELAAQFVAATDADVKTRQRQLKRAIFGPTNTTFTDRLVDHVSLAIKALLNADSSAIPLGPNGETFTASTHTHYLWTAGVAIAAADLTSLVDTVVEHHPVGQAVVYINKAQETAVRALTGFTAYVDARIVQPGGSTTSIGNRPLEMMNTGNRAIGIYGAAEIWVKPWMPAGYLFAYVEGSPAPLVMRERAQGSSGLVIAAEDEAHPLRARTLEAEYGVGVWTRTNGAALYIDTGAAGAYVAPTIS